jgi:hypothetical protein
MSRYGQALIDIALVGLGIFAVAFIAWALVPR